MSIFKKNDRFEPRPTAYRAWDGKNMVVVQTICWNAAGMIWYGPGNQFAWAWIDPRFNEWSAENPQPSKNDICPLMQWTGLKDKNNKDIWEGDIVKFKVEVYEHDFRDEIGEVFYENGIFFFSRKGGWCCIDANLANHSIEVVGNIFQNPELL